MTEKKIRNLVRSQSESWAGTLIEEIFVDEKRRYFAQGVSGLFIRSDAEESLIYAEIDISVFPLHCHRGEETIHVLRGHIRCPESGEEARESERLVFAAGEVHSVEFLVPSRVLMSHKPGLIPIPT